MTDTTLPRAATTVDTAAVRSVVAADLRQRSTTPLGASMTFAWRAMLKIKHVPMQLFDVTAFPVMFVLLYTYLFGGALASSPREYLQLLLPGIISRLQLIILFGQSQKLFGVADFHIHLGQRLDGLSQFLLDMKTPGVTCSPLTNMAGEEDFNEVVFDDAFVPDAMLLGQERHFSLPLADYHRRHAFVWAMQDEVVERCGARILDPLPHLCEDGVCPSTDASRPIYRDADHFSEFGNRRLVPMFREVFAPAP